MTNGGETKSELELASRDEMLEMLLEHEADDRHDRERDRGRNLRDLAPDRPNEMARRRDNDHRRRERDEHRAVPQIVVGDVLSWPCDCDAPRELWASSIPAAESGSVSSNAVRVGPPPGDSDTQSPTCPYTIV